MSNDELTLGEAVEQYNQKVGPVSAEDIDAFDSVSPRWRELTLTEFKAEAAAQQDRLLDFFNSLPPGEHHG